MASLQIFNFRKNEWEDEFGSKLVLDDIHSIDNDKLQAVITADPDEIFTIATKKSYFKNLILSISENANFSKKAESLNDKDIVVEHNRTEPLGRYGHASVKFFGMTY